MLFYGNRYWGITEANYLLVILHIMTGFFGPTMWRADVAAMLDIKLPFTLRVNDCLLVFIAFFAVSYSLAAFYRVLQVDQVPLHVNFVPLRSWPYVASYVTLCTHCLVVDGTNYHLPLSPCSKCISGSFLWTQHGQAAC